MEGRGAGEVRKKQAEIVGRVQSGDTPPKIGGGLEGEGGVSEGMKGVGIWR